MNNNKITQFIEPDTLQSIGAIRLNLLFQKFAGPINAANLHLPTPDPQRPDSFAELAGALRTRSCHRNFRTLSARSKLPLRRRTPTGSKTPACAEFPAYPFRN
jgi:hypothetical protein